MPSEGSDSWKTSQGRTASDPGRRALDELERRYVRKDSPSPESAGAVRIEGPGFRGSFRPERVKRAVPWLLLLLAAFGITGSSVLAWITTANSVRGKVDGLEQVNAQLRTELDDVKASYRSHEKRIKALEGAPNAPLVVTK